MTEQEKKLLKIAIPCVLLVVIFRLVPVVGDFYDEIINDRDQVAKKINRIVRMIEQKDRWEDKGSSILEQEDELEKTVYQGDSNQQISARIQRDLQELAEASDVKIDSTDLPEFVQMEDWLMINQSLSFSVDSEKAIAVFLNKLKKSQPRLRIVDFEERLSHKRLNGKMKVVAFSHLPGTTTAAKGELAHSQ